jgi:hypothetical protein
LAGKGICIQGDRCGYVYRPEKYESNRGFILSGGANKEAGVACKE